MSSKLVDPEARESFLIRHKGELSFAAAILGWVATLVVSKMFPQSATRLIKILQGGFEAATVGGAADWLAVKMIFDEIKIGKFRIVPASGIIPRKQKAIARGAGNLVATEWLTPASIRSVLERVNVASELTDFADQLVESGKLKDLVTDFLIVINKILARPETRARIEEFVGERVRSIKVGKLLGEHVNPERVENLLDEFIPFLADKLVDLINTPEVYELIRSKIASNRKGFVAEVLIDPIEVTENTIRSANILLRDIEYNPEQPLRKKLTQNICEWIVGLKENENERDKLDQQFQELLEQMDWQNWTHRMMDRLQQYLEDESASPDGELQMRVQNWVKQLIQGLRKNEEWQKQINSKVIELIENLIRKNQSKIAEIVEENLTRISPDELKNQFKRRTYSDMQWIRVNGAVAGFAIGILIALVNWALD